MYAAPPDLERRYRRFLNGWGDVIDPLVCILGDRDERVRTRAWAALIISRIHLHKGRLCLAASFHRLSFSLFRSQRGFPPDFWMNRALILRAGGKAGAAERLLRRIFSLSLGKGWIIAAAGAAALLADLLARVDRLDDSASFLAVACRCYEALGRNHERVKMEMIAALLDSKLGKIEQAVERVSLLLAEGAVELDLRERICAALLLAELFLIAGRHEKADVVLRGVCRERHILDIFRLLDIRALYLRHGIRAAAGDACGAREIFERAESMRSRLGFGLLGCAVSRRPGRGWEDLCSNGRISYVTRGSAVMRHAGGAPDTGERPAADQSNERFMTVDRSSDRFAATDFSNEQSVKADHANEQFLTADGRLLSLLEEMRSASIMQLPVIIRGESGVGKEVLSRLIHRWSGRGNEPFIAVNAAALPEGLFESMLFGHSRGAFTGAVSKHAGLLAEAKNGSLFLDEIGDLHPGLQAKLLRFLDSGEYLPLGEGRMKRSGARIITATNRNLEKDIREGRFRQDLYHRLAILSFDIPPLRKRRCDIPLLVRFVFDMTKRHYGLGPFTLGEGAMRLFLAYEWPGNVRELQGEIIRAAIRKKRGTLGVFDFSENLLGGIHRGEEFHEQGLVEKVRRLEREEIIRALNEAGGNHTRAAASLGLGRTTLIYKMKRLGIE